MTNEEILDAIGAKTVIELKELLDAFEEKFTKSKLRPFVMPAKKEQGGVS